MTIKHPFAAMGRDISAWIARAEVLPARAADVQKVGARLVGFYRAGHYGRASALTGVPVVWAAASFEREASSNFRLSPAQGDPLDEVSQHVPRGLGPYAGPDAWDQSAAAAYHIDGLDLVGAGNWTMERACYEGVAFNGFGPIDYHGQIPTYVVGGTTLETIGKYAADGKWAADQWDTQLGILPVMQEMIRIAPELGEQLAASAGGAPPPLPARPTPSGLLDHVGSVDWLQASLNKVGAELDVDGNYGRMTRNAVRAFQAAHPPLDADGIAGPHTVAVLEALTQTTAAKA